MGVRCTVGFPIQEIPSSIILYCLFARISNNSLTTLSGEHLVFKELSYKKEEEKRKRRPAPPFLINSPKHVQLLRIFCGFSLAHPLRFHGTSF